MTINPGIIRDIEITKLDRDVTITRNKLMKFQLRFRVSNKLKAGSMIKLVIPASIEIYNDRLLGVPNSYWVEFGLEDKSEEDPVRIEFDETNDFLFIKNYKEKDEPDIILLRFWARTPDNSGESSPIVITAYTNEQSEYVIDTDDKFAKIDVLDVRGPNSRFVSLSEDFAGLNRTVNVIFTIRPAITLPAFGFIKVIFDNDLIINEVDTTKCFIWDRINGVYVNAPSCFKRNREISIQLSSLQYTANITNFFKLERVVESPGLGGVFLTDITTYQPDGVTSIESYTEVLSFRAAKLVFPIIRVYPQVRFETSVLDLEFSVAMDIPHSRPQNITTETVSFISIGIGPSGPTSLQSDLGYTKYGKGNIPCYAIMGLVPVRGSQIDCKVNPGEAPSIRITNYHAIKAGTRIRILVAEFTNPDGNFITDVKIIRKFNRKLTEMTAI